MSTPRLLAGASLLAVSVLLVPVRGQVPGAGGPPGFQSPEAPQPSFRAGVELVSLNVTVTDMAGRYVRGLDRSAFLVFEDGAQQDISFFTPGNLPVALSILMDTSASMEDKLQTSQDAGIGFVRRLRAHDVAQIIDFDSRVQIAQPFTSSVEDLESAIRRTSAGGSTSLHNALYISLKELRRIRAHDAEDVRRQAIIVLSDGEDTSSLVDFDEVLELAKRSETAVYAIGLRSTEPYRQRGFSEAEFVLRQLAQQTGGRVFFPKQISELSGVYGQIAEELSSQYTIGYTSRNPKRDGAWRRVLVRLTASNLTARSKQGYYAPSTN